MSSPQHFRVLIVQDTEPHEIPDGWFIHSAFPVRTAGVNATIALILVERLKRKRLWRS
jgi:hypothetical protein